MTQYAVKGYISNVFGPGATFGYNFNPSDFIVSGYDISIRFPQDPGEPLFTNSPAFNLTQQHIAFLDSLMLALRDSNYTYFADRDFYGTGKGNSPFFTKSLILTTSGTGAASWDSTTKVLNIPVASGGPGGGGSSPYYLPYNGDSSSYIGGDTLLHHLPPQPPPGDSIDYGFTALTTIYNENGPGEYNVTPHSITANPDNTNFPFRQLKSLDIGGWTSSSYISFTKNTTFSTTAFTFLRAFIRLKSVVDIPSSLSFRFYLNGSPISSIISCVNYGLTKNKVGSYMNISIPLTAFGFTSNNYDEIRFEFGGSNASGIYMDLVQLQNAAIDENKYVTDVHRIPGTVTVQQVLGGQNVFSFNDSVGVAVDTQYLRRDINLKLNITDTAGKWAAINHTHTESQVTNLVTDLAGKEFVITAPNAPLKYWNGYKQFGSLNTDSVSEATNKYYTDTRARAAISVTGSGTYNSTTGVINISAVNAWAMGGNVLTNSGTQYIGTNNNTSMRFFTNGTQRIIIDSSGNTTVSAAAISNGGITIDGSNAPAYSLSNGGLKGIFGLATAPDNYFFGNVANDVVLRAQSGGRVAIGSFVNTSTTPAILTDEVNNVSFPHYKNNVAGDSILSTDAAGKLKLVLKPVSSQWTTSGTSISYNTGQVVVSPSGTSNSQLKVNALEVQSYAVNNAWFGDNTYFNGSNFIRRAAGYSGFFYFTTGEGQFRFGSTGSAGSTVNEGGNGTFGKVVFKANLDGSVALGGNMPNAAGTYTGNSLLVNSKGVTVLTLTKAQRDAIASPTQGLMVFVTDSGGYLSWYNSGWQKVSSISDP